MGGEPLCDENLFTVSYLIDTVRCVYPEKRIYLWTGYTIEELEERMKEYGENDFRTTCLRYIKDNLFCLIDGRYEEKYRDITLVMRGSSNQRIYYFD